MHKVNVYSFEISKSNMGLKYEALKTIHTGGILRLLLYGAPVWIKAIENCSYKSKIKSTKTYKY